MKRNSSNLKRFDKYEVRKSERLNSKDKEEGESRVQEVREEIPQISEEENALI